MSTLAFNPYKRALENIMEVLTLKGITFSQTEAADIVGGREKLKRLIIDGKVEADKKNRRQNGSWRCSAADVLRHCRNMRKKTSQTDKTQEL